MNFKGDIMKEALIKMGAIPSKHTKTVHFKRAHNSLPRTSKGHVWTSHGHTWDFIQVRYEKVTAADIRLLLKLLNYDSLPARHPLRRALARMIVHDQLSINEFYDIVRAKRVSIKKKATHKVPLSQSKWAPIDEDEINRILYENRQKRKLSEEEKQKKYFIQACRRMKVSIPENIDDVVVRAFCALDQLDLGDPSHPGWVRPRRGNYRYCLLNDETKEVVQRYINEYYAEYHRKIQGLFISGRRFGGIDCPVLIIIDGCRYDSSALEEELMPSLII